MPDHFDSEKVSKGAFIAFYPKTDKPKIIEFQLNPESIRRSLQPQTTGVEGTKANNTREAISFVLYMDSHLGDDYFQSTNDEKSKGVLPYLSALELLLSNAGSNSAPSPVSRSRGLFSRFNREPINVERPVSRKETPLIALMLGESRTIPVRIRSLQITEQAFDKRLQPIRASVKVNLDVLTESESHSDPELEKLVRGYQRFKNTVAHNR